MRKSIRPLIMLSAIVVGILSASLTSQAGPFDRVPMCKGGFGGQQIQVFTYLVSRYISAGWTPGTCPTS